MKAIANEQLQGSETSTVHRFERAGLGKAPFRFTGRVTENVCGAPNAQGVTVGAPGQPGGHCHYCYTGIKYEFWVRSADGKEFPVGCDCIHKTGDAGLIQQISVAERKLRDVKNAAAKARKQAKLAARVEAAKVTLGTVRGTLAGQPHPNQYYAGQGKTMLDYVSWCFENRQGERAAFVVEKAFTSLYPEGT